MIHLHCHTEYSTLDGLMKVDEMLDRAEELGATAVAMTDHACISGLPEFYNKAKARGIKPIIGCEFYCCDQIDGVRGEKRDHLNVWAKNWNGVLSIMEQLTLANRQFFYRPRITLEQALNFKDCIVSTACCIGILRRDDYKEWFDRFHMTYGDDLVMEIMPHTVIDEKTGVDLQRVVNERAVELSTRYNVPLVASNDAHYARKEDSVTHDILLAIQTNSKINDPNRWRMSPLFWMSSISEMSASFRGLKYIPEVVWKDAMINAKTKVADLCNAEMPDFPIELPNPHDEPVEKVFGEHLMRGWQEKIASFVPAEKHQGYRERLLYEIGVIKEKQFTTYFLVVEDMIKWARSQDIMVGAARGSSCGSLVCYLLDITQIDPLKFGLYFERFLSPLRLDYPDVDVDFQDDRRAEVIEYIRSKYGHDKTAMISTFGYLGAKSGFRDVARLSGIPMDVVNKLSKLVAEGTVKDESGKVAGTYAEEDAFDHVPELIQFKKDYPWIVEQALKLNGRIRQMGVHAAGLIVAKRPLLDCAALVKKSNTEAICWDKRTCEKPFGLIKMDLLGLSTLTVLNHCKQLVKENYGHDIDFTQIPLEDERVLNAFARGETVGIFQFESSAAQHWLRAIGTKSFMEVTDVTALNRPGSLESGETERYAKIARGEEYETYSCPQIEKVLKSTKGVLIYQESMMRIFVEMGGFTFAEADLMRKIVGKKLGADEFNKHRQKFVDGCAANGISESIADDTFGKMVSFANYSFNLSHACAYTHLSVWSMFFKLYFPTEYMCSLLSKTTKDDNIPGYIVECQRMGIQVELPDINKSAGTDFIIRDGAIVAPLSSIKGVGAKAVQHIVEVREAGTVFLSTKDFEERIEKRKCNKRVRECLFNANAFFSLGEYELDEEIRIRNLKQLLSIFETLPKIDPNEGRPVINKDMHAALMRDINACAAEGGNDVLKPIVPTKPAIMWVNNNTQYESDHLTGKATRWLPGALKNIGLPSSKLYYTSPLKCHFGQINDAPKKCIQDCPEKFLRREIELVQPKLIVCSATQFLKFFGADSSKAGEMSNRIIFNEEFQCYVMFTYSPQYAQYNDGAREHFTKSLEILQKIYTPIPL